MNTLNMAAIFWALAIVIAWADGQRKLAWTMAVFAALTLLVFTIVGLMNAASHQREALEAMKKTRQ